MSCKGFLFAVAFFLCSTALIAQPKIKPIPDIDLGDAYQGQKMQHVISVQNIGSDTLRISEVKAQCGCTATLMSEKTIAPGKDAKLNFTFDTHNYTGRVTKQIYVSSNDTSTPKLTVNFTANVIQIFSLNPQFFSFDNAKVDSVYTKVITITNPSQKQSIKITGVEPKMDDLKVTLMKNELMPGEQTQIQAEFHPTKPGNPQGVIELQTNHPQYPKYEIRVYSWVNRK